MPFVPFIRTPFTDVMAVPCMHQNFGNCRELEMRLINCFEAYGLGAGMERGKCTDLFNDFSECYYRDKQRQRLFEMKAERARQLKEGKSKEEVYLPEPRLDSYQL